jgi:hypothetical protein
LKALRIYLDTSVIGGCCDQEFAQWSNGLFKDFEMGLFRPVISEVVGAEIADAPKEVLEKYAELLSLDPEFVGITEAAEELANRYLQRGILSSNFSDDALHIALATVANVDVLTSWNFKHVVHFDKIRLFNAVNLELGYKSIQIYSPREVTHHGNKDN